jgi:hypothetical protein
MGKGVTWFPPSSYTIRQGQRRQYQPNQLLSKAKDERQRTGWTVHYAYWAFSPRPPTLGEYLQNPAGTRMEGQQRGLWPLEGHDVVL